MKLKKRLLTALLFCCAFIFQSATAQETDYFTSYFKYDYPPTLKFDGSSIKTFDLKVLMLGDDPILAPNEMSKDKTLNSSFKFNIAFNGLQQVDSTSIGDLHIISVVQRFLPKTGFSKAGGILTTNVGVYTTIKNSDGTEVYHNQFNDENFNTTYGKDLTNSVIAKLVIENAIGSSLISFQDRLTGFKARMEVKFASLEDVKKYPELKEFEAQAKEMKKVLANDGVDAYLLTAGKYLDFWQKQSNSTIEKNADEVKRAAYQNLAVYYILKNDTLKAQELIKLYKPIDKIQSEMMGLLKTKNSETLEKLIEKLNPEMKVLAPADKKVSLQQVTTDFLYTVINGTVAIDDKKNGGIYTGTIYIKKTVPTGKVTGGGISDLDGEDFDVTIKTGSADIKTKLSKIKRITDDKKGIYTVIKGGGNMLGDMSAVSIGNSSYILMKETYSNAKVSLFRIFFPLNSGGEGSMFIRKTGDEEGVRTSLLNFKKNLTTYLSDCAKTTEMIKQSENINADINRILDVYAKCN